MAKTDFRSVDECRFPHSQPVPVKLIERIARFRAKEAAEDARVKLAASKER